ncbi:unnamed protein product [marine sediment metagenome]|uniref:Uncharacterized protein n=1 Tax=marine sediment metagenome TaxID=412755 RepID=X1H678_9ZZZZ
MSKNLEELKELNENDYKGLRLQDVVMYYVIPVLEGFEKRLKKIEAELGIYTEEEIKKLKVGGTDPD